MRFGASSTLCFSIFLDSLLVNYSLVHINIDAFCSKIVVIKTVMEIQIDYNWRSNFCRLTLHPHDPNSWLQAVFEFYSVQKPSTTCSRGAVYLYDSTGYSLLGNKGFCKRSSPKGRYELGDNGSILVTKKTYFGNLKMTLRIVELFDKNETCPTGTLDCDEDEVCIAAKLECEGHQDCPNARDEGDQCPKISIDILQIVVIVFLALFVCCTGTITCVYLSDRLKDNKRPSQQIRRTFDASNFGVDEVYRPSKESELHSPKSEDISEFFQANLPSLGLSPNTSCTVVPITVSSHRGSPVEYPPINIEPHLFYAGVVDDYYCEDLKNKALSLSPPHRETLIN